MTDFDIIQVNHVLTKVISENLVLIPATQVLLGLLLTASIMFYRKKEVKIEKLTIESEKGKCPVNGKIVSLPPQKRIETKWINVPYR